MFRRAIERRSMAGYVSSGAPAGEQLTPRMWALRPTSLQSASYVADESTLSGRYVRLSDETAIGSTLRVPQPGRCIDLNGTSSVVTYTYAGILSSANDYTIALRFRLDATTSGMTLLTTHDGSSNGIELRINGSSTLEWASNTSTAAGGIVTTNRWYTVAASIRDNNTITAYLYTHPLETLAKVIDAAAFTATASANSVLYVGNDSAGNWADGKVAMLAVYGDQARTDEELQAMCQSNVPEGHDILCWFEDGAGTRCWDASGTAWHGVGTNVTHLANGTNDVYSRQNEYGYTAGTGSNGAQVGEYIPRVESTVLYLSNPFSDRDAALNLVGNKGKVSYGPIVNKPVVTLNGTDEYIQMGLVGTDVTRIVMTVRLLQDNQVLMSLNGSPNGLRVTGGVLDYDGTSVAAIVDGATLTASNAGAALNDNQWHRIDVTLPSAIGADNVRVGSNFSLFGNIAVADVQLHGTALVHYPITEQSGPNVHDVGTVGAHAQIISSDLPTVWGTLAGFGGHIEQYGARLQAGAYVPGRDGVTAADGFPIDVGPRRLVGASTLDLTGGEAASPYAIQMAAYIDTTYSVGDGDAIGLGEGVRYATVNADGDDNILVVLPPAGPNDSLFRDIE